MLLLLVHDVMAERRCALQMRQSPFFFGPRLSSVAGRGGTAAYLQALNLPFTMPAPSWTRYRQAERTSTRKGPSTRRRGPFVFRGRAGRCNIGNFSPAAQFPPWCGTRQLPNQYSRATMTKAHAVFGGSSSFFEALSSFINRLSSALSSPFTPSDCFSNLRCRRANSARVTKILLSALRMSAKTIRIKHTIVAASCQSLGNQSLKATIRPMSSVHYQDLCVLAGSFLRGSELPGRPTVAPGLIRSPSNWLRVAP